MYVIVKTDNRWRGAEAVMAIYGPWLSEERALEAVHELRAELPSEYASHDEYPVDYEVRRVEEVEQ
jgi:hypothetical protein